MPGEVEVIKAESRVVNRRKNLAGNGFLVERKRVAAYVRVSTDGEEQLQSFQSQKIYYQDKISKNKEWVMVGIYADEAITGTKTVKRDGFLKMINDCMEGLVDVILTKSISRFSRNLVDTLQYVRMLKEKGVAVIFEKENINTLLMEGEMALALLSTIAQNEVESLSANVKLGIKMKMKRGELMGFNGCLGYDYHPEDKSLTVNSREAEIVREIFDMYLGGYGALTIAKELTRLGRKNKKGEVKWTESGVRFIINNEKYKGDLLLGKTFTVDPISKRRLENMGEEEQYYVKEHHEPIVSPEIWDAAQKIRKSRYRTGTMSVPVARKKYSRKYAFSSMIECAFCGKYLTRRAHNQTSSQTKPVWKCRTATNFGISNCPYSKAIDEVIVENAFLEMFHLLAGNFDDVLDSVINSVEETLSNDESAVMLQKVDKTLNLLESKRKKLTDMLLDDTITKEAYDVKYTELTRKINQAKGERSLYSSNVEAQKHVSQRMKEIRVCISKADMLDKFDRVVFESIVEKVIIGNVNEDGTVDPYKLTFVLKGMADQVISDSKNRYRKLNKGIR